MAGMTQEEAVFEAAVVQKQGSDASLQTSTTHAMKGLMDLAAQKRPSAIQNGYKAYGQFRNSEDMDMMRLRNQLSYYKLHTENLMNSKATSRLRMLEPVEDMNTDFSRLDPKFLREGEAGRVADEFEKKSGMKRETFLKAMARASQSSISTSDPQLVDKVISRFESFVKDIPNAEFRQNVEKTINEVPATVRKGMIAKGVQKIAEIMATLPGDKSKIAFTLPQPEAERGPAALPPVTDALPAVAIEEKKPEPEHAVPNTAMVPTESGFRGIEKEKFAGDVIGSVMQTAIDEQKDQTIFRQVSKRYRAITPKLSLMRETSS